MDSHFRIKKLYAKLPLLVLMSIFIILPYHAFLTTWAGANFGFIDLFRIWKEILLSSLSVYAIWLVFTNNEFRLTVTKQRKIIIIASLYVFYSVIWGIVSYFFGKVNSTALIYALLINLRIPLVLIVSFIISTRFPILREKWAAIILIPSIFVVLFGMLQATVLPERFLEHFGYSKFTILPFQYVDNKPDFVRVQSTLRGANPLGAYMVVVVATIAAILMKTRNSRKRMYLGIYGIVCLFVLFNTYSRSAWIGALITLVLIGWWLAGRSLFTVSIKKVLLMAVVLAMVAFVLVITKVNTSYYVQNTILHTDSSSKSDNSSNEERSRRIRSGAIEVVREPFGRGPGTAGPASTRNTKAPPRISENYYLQIGQEVGWIGLGLFLWLNFMVCKALWGRRSEVMCVALLASFIGIVAINMLSHAWADDVLGLLWWGMAGIALSPAIIKQKRHHNAKTQEKTT